MLVLGLYEDEYEIGLESCMMFTQKNWLFHGPIYFFISVTHYDVTDKINDISFDFDLIFGVLTPFSGLFQLYHGDQF